MQDTHGTSQLFELFDASLIQCLQTAPPTHDFIAKVAVLCLEHVVLRIHGLDLVEGVVILLLEVDVDVGHAFLKVLNFTVLPTNKVLQPKVLVADAVGFTELLC